MNTICPHCNEEFPETPDEYLGMTCECTNCHNSFVIEKAKTCSNCGTANTARSGVCRQCGKHFPPRISPSLPSRPPEIPPESGKQTSQDRPAVRRKPKKKTENGSNPIWKGIKTVGWVVLVVAFAALKIYTSESSKMTSAKLAENVKSNAEKSLFQSPQSVYHGAVVKDVKLRDDKTTSQGTYKTYRGEIVFERSGRTYSRPIIVSYEEDKSQFRYFYSIDFDYSKYPEFLKEDADIFFRQLANNSSELKPYQFVSAERLSADAVKDSNPVVRGINPASVHYLRCIVRNGSGDRLQVDIKVTQERDTRNLTSMTRGIPEYQLTYLIMDVKEL